MDTKYGNELIGKFMGDDELNGYPKDTSDYRDPNWYSPLYDRSWKWLMPVVEKIRDIDNQGDEEYYRLKDEVNLEIFNTSILCWIDGVYERVIQFIEWYNNIYLKQINDTSISDNN
jgi:hypothetical protein